jgi:1-acyl-sn-glycerol-3-phosphate acyltransferase
MVIFVRQLIVMATVKKQPDDILIDFTPPSKRFVENFTKPFYAYFTPEFFGLENLNEKKPALYIANHSIYGVTDGTLYVAEAYLKKNVYIRGLADNMHFMVPGWRNIFMKLGFARASRENCSEMMKQKQHILVFPGGSREICKRKGEEYKLVWKNHTGFARMAIQHGYDIIPIINVGGDDAYDIVKDPEEVIPDNFWGKLFKKTPIYKNLLKEGEILPPLAYGVGETIFPKPVKLYFSYGKRISTKRFKKDAESKENQWQLRNEVELAMNKMMLELIEYRAKDNTKDKGLIRTFLSNRMVEK